MFFLALTVQKFQKNRQSFQRINNCQQRREHPNKQCQFLSHKCSFPMRLCRNFENIRLLSRPNARDLRKISPFGRNKDFSRSLPSVAEGLEMTGLITGFRYSDTVSYGKRISNRIRLPKVVC